jgi:ActD protein
VKHRSSRRLLYALFEREEDVLGAVRALRKEGHRIADVHAPYAVHGLDRAAGLPPSRIGWVCAVAGFLGAGAMLWFQRWTSAVSWAINVGGKPFNSVPAFVPVTFEVAVLLGGLSTVAAFLIRSRLYPGRQPARNLPRLSDDRFLVVVDEPDASFDPARVGALCRSFGAVSVEEALEELPEETA